MVTRYCGSVAIWCRLVPAAHMSHGEQYECKISERGLHLTTQHVGLPAHLRHAIDSPKAYDEAAHAALSFAVDAGMDESGLAYTDSGFEIKRSLPLGQKRWR